MPDHNDAGISGTDKLSIPRHYCPSDCRHRALATTTLGQSSNLLKSENATVHVAEAKIACKFMFGPNGMWRDSWKHATP